eukprot:COSAG05_NODE_573_length_8601_cov_58.330981_17_plen_79_part_01
MMEENYYAGATNVHKWEGVAWLVARPMGACASRLLRQSRPETEGARERESACKWKRKFVTVQLIIVLDELISCVGSYSC